MSTTITVKPTAAGELLAMPDDGSFDELIEGRPRHRAPARGEHGTIGSELGRRLGTFVVHRRLGNVYSADTGYFFGHDPNTVLAPDVAIVSTEKLPPREERRGYLDIMPDLVVEVVSLNDRQLEVDEKIARSVAAEVRPVWVADPRHRPVQDHRPDAAAITLGEDDTLDGDSVPPEFRLAVSDICRE